MFSLNPMVVVVVSDALTKAAWVAANKNVLIVALMAKC
jgi:hypothetical protein